LLSSFSSCSKDDEKKKEITYDLTINGTAITQDGEIKVDYHFTNADNDAQGKALAEAVKNDNEQDGVTGFVEKELNNLIKLESYDVTVTGYV
jgi:hypothetical protein